MHNILFHFSNKSKAESLIKDVLKTGFEFNFRITTNQQALADVIDSFTPELLVIHNDSSKHFEEAQLSNISECPRIFIQDETGMGNNPLDDIVSLKEVSTLTRVIKYHLEKEKLSQEIQSIKEHYEKQRIEYENRIETTNEDLRKRKEQLIHSQKMEALGLMASGIAHNFNNILQAIVGYVEFAMEDLDNSSQRYSDLKQIEKLTKRASMLTKNLLAVGKEQYLQKTEIDLHDIIKPIVDLTNRKANNKVLVSYEENKNLPAITADGAMIDQVVLNIFMNSVDAMPEGGNITVVTDYIQLDKEFCHTNAWAMPGSYVKLSISDTGQGMDTDTKRRIFEPYFTTKQLTKGTGLGLATVFGVISQHEGLLNVESEIGKGTIFDVYLPIS